MAEAQNPLPPGQADFCAQPAGLRTSCDIFSDDRKENGPSGVHPLRSLRSWSSNNPYLETAKWFRSTLFSLAPSEVLAKSPKQGVCPIHSRQHHLLRTFNVGRWAPVLGVCGGPSGAQQPRRDSTHAPRGTHTECRQDRRGPSGWLSQRLVNPVWTEEWSPATEDRREK